MFKTIVIGLIVFMLTGSLAFGQDWVERKVDSLFVIAASGDMKYRDLVEPTRDEIAAIGAPAVPYLVEKYDTKSAPEKWAVHFIIRKIGTPAVPELLKALNHDDPLVVGRVCFVLGDVGDSTAVGPLMAVSVHERWQVRDQAVGALGKIGDTLARPTVLTAFADSIGQVRKSASVAAGKLGTNEAIGKLVHQLGDDFYGARLTALDALLTLDTAMVIDAVAGSLSSPVALVGDLACDLLGKIGGDRALELLLVQTKSERTARRAHAAVALILADPLDNCDYRRFFAETEPDRLVRLRIESALYLVQNEQGQAH